MKVVGDMCFKIPSTVTFHDVDGGIFIYHKQSENCFGLDGISLDIWNMLSQGVNVRNTVLSIVEKYDADTATVATDVEKFIEQLLQKGLLEGR